MGDILFFSIASKRSKSEQTIVSLKNVIDVTNPFIKENIILVHPWGGCDTTSSTYGLQKSTILKYLKGNQPISQIRDQPNIRRVKCQSFRNIRIGDSIISSAVWSKTNDLE